MNGKAYKGLSLPGLAAHIASSLLLYNGGKGTINDCKHAIAHNVRAYQRRLIALKKAHKVWISSSAARSDGPIELEHAIPVGCLMNLLFHEVKDTNLEDAAARVGDLIESNTVLVWVTKLEHAALNKRYQCTMPQGFDTYPWLDELARYKQTEGVSTLTLSVNLADKAKPLDDDLIIETEEDFKEPRP